VPIPANYPAASIPPAISDLFSVSLGLLGGHDAEPEGVPIGWLAPDWWRDQPSRCSVEQEGRFVKLLGKLHGFLNTCSRGVVPIDSLQHAGIEKWHLDEARRHVWRWKQDLRRLVIPGAKQVVLDGVAAANERVLAISTLLSAITLRLSGQLAPSGVELIDVPRRGGPFVRLRWRKNIHSALLMSPVLYLDATGAKGVELAKAWLPRIELAVEASAKAPHMRVIQLTDTEMSYDKIETESTARDLVRVVEVLGGNGLVISPMKLQQRWEGAGQLTNFVHWHFGAIRGLDEARSVSHLTIVSRPLSPAADVELIAETIFGQSVNRCPRGEWWYSKSPVGRLMADGTGRRLLACRHTDPMIEAVRFAICEGELLQAVGRGRGIQHDADTPLVVLILTNVPIPVPVDETISWIELRDTIGPIEVLAARGVVPLGYGGMAAALNDWFTDADAAKEWFRYRPEVQARLDVIRTQAKRGERIATSELVGNPFKYVIKGNSHQLRSFRYRRSDERQSNVALIDVVTHSDQRAAVEAVLGKLDLFAQIAQDVEDDRKHEAAESVVAGDSDTFFAAVRQFFDDYRPAA
jgi:hypothetical protein